MVPAAWNPRSLPDLSDRRIVITGATAGLGYFTAEQLAGAGATVVLAARDAGRTEAAIASVRSRVPEARLESVVLDLADLASVERAADELAGSRVDGLIANAGRLPAARRARTTDGFELVFGTNHLGHFALVARLYPTLRRSPGARLVALGSLTHRGARLDFDDLMNGGRYRGFRQYGRSKLAVMTFAFELDRRLRDAGITDLHSLSAHPGYADGALTPARSGIVPRFNPLRRAVIGFIGQGKDRGAWPIVRAVVEGEGGQFWGPGGWMELRGAPVPALIAPRAVDPVAGARLWEASERLTGVTLDVV